MPYHYAPFAHDCAELCDAGWQPALWGNEGPIHALMQLVAVLPPASAHLLAESYRPLVSESCSPLAHMFPVKVDLDYRGKKHAWQERNADHALRGGAMLTMLCEGAQC